MDTVICILTVSQLLHGSTASKGTFLVKTHEDTHFLVEVKDNISKDSNDYGMDSDYENKGLNLESSTNHSSTMETLPYVPSNLESDRHNISDFESDHETGFRGESISDTLSEDPSLRQSLQESEFPPIHIPNGTKPHQVYGSIRDTIVNTTDLKPLNPYKAYKSRNISVPPSYQVFGNKTNEYQSSINSTFTPPNGTQPYQVFGSVRDHIKNTSDVKLSNPYLSKNGSVSDSLDTYDTKMNQIHGESDHSQIKQDKFQETLDNYLNIPNGTLPHQVYGSVRDQIKNTLDVKLPNPYGANTSKNESVSDSFDTYDTEKNQICGESDHSQLNPKTFNETLSKSVNIPTGTQPHQVYGSVRDQIINTSDVKLPNPYGASTFKNKSVSDTDTYDTIMNQINGESDHASLNQNILDETFNKSVNVPNGTLPHQVYGSIRNQIRNKSPSKPPNPYKAYTPTNK